MSDEVHKSPTFALTRRELLKLAGGAVAAAPLAGAARPAAAGTPAAAAEPLFFTAPELRLLDELTELIIPTDEHSPGARAALVAGYIDRRLAEYDPTIPDLRDEREAWKAGLAGLEALSHEMHGAGLLDVSEAKRSAVRERVADAGAPETPASRFFGRLKRWTAHGYYTSQIGLHQDLEYKGNTALAEFVGIDADSV